MLLDLLQYFGFLYFPVHLGSQTEIEDKDCQSWLGGPETGEEILFQVSNLVIGKTCFYLAGQSFTDARQLVRLDSISRFGVVWGWLWLPDCLLQARLNDLTELVVSVFGANQVDHGVDGLHHELVDVLVA